MHAWIALSPPGRHRVGVPADACGMSCQTRIAREAGFCIADPSGVWIDDAFQWAQPA